MVRAGYENSIKNFKEEDEDKIYGIIEKNFSHDSKKRQKRAWISEINILKEQLSNFEEGDIIFEYNIPRMGSIIDNVLLIDGIVFILEFKNNEEYSFSTEKEYKKEYLSQLENYVYLLKNFHYESEQKIIVPILVVTEADPVENERKILKNKIFETQKANKNNLCKIILESLDYIKNNYQDYDKNLDLSNWSKSKYKPTPTILEAAIKLYNSHEDDKIKGHGSDDRFLNETQNRIEEIISDSKNNNKKSIIFLTGDPGAGKTLIGLNTAIKNTEKSLIEDNKSLSVFLTGNKPLVEVLIETLARGDRNQRNGKNEAKNIIKSFIQHLYSFRIEAIKSESEPVEKILIFDEAQRSWTKEETEKFLNQARIKETLGDKINDYVGMSEAEFLISYMDRHKDWSVILCLVGEGQEIHNGEAGISEWFDALKKFPKWDIYLNKKNLISNIGDELNITEEKYLYLNTTLRSLNSPNLADFIEDLLDNKPNEAKEKLDDFKDYYPLFITRNLNLAKKWVKNETNIVKSLERNEETKKEPFVRYGLLAESNSMRLRPEGIFLRRKEDNEIISWFLNDEKDIRSSNHLEIAATEFDIQGLEIDYSILAWDGNLRYVNNEFEYYKMKNSANTNWTPMNDIEEVKYLINSYRVLLTRARRGMVIFIPEGDEEDKTRKKEFYDGTYNYLKNIGIEEL